MSKGTTVPLRARNTFPWWRGTRNADNLFLETQTIVYTRKHQPAHELGLCCQPPKIDPPLSRPPHATTRGDCNQGMATTSGLTQIPHASRSIHKLRTAFTSVLNLRGPNTVAPRDVHGSQVRSWEASNISTLEWVVARGNVLWGPAQRESFRAEAPRHRGTEARTETFPMSVPRWGRSRGGGAGRGGGQSLLITGPAQTIGWDVCAFSSFG